MPGLALTFDDGPDPRTTPRLLDLLARSGATATFFVIARRAQRHPELVARMLAEGHTVGLHCDEHVRHTDRSPGWLRADTARALDRLRRAGARPVLWRAPWGVHAPWTEAVAAEHGLRMVGWTVDTRDWRGDPAATMFAACREALGPEAVVLAHDGIGPGARRADARETVAWAELVLAHARQTGLAVRALRARPPVDPTQHSTGYGGETFGWSPLD